MWRKGYSGERTRSLKMHTVVTLWWAVRHGCGDVWMDTYQYRTTHPAQLRRRDFQLGWSHCLWCLLGSRIQDASNIMARVRTLHGRFKSLDQSAGLEFCTSLLPCTMGVGTLTPKPSHALASSGYWRPSALVLLLLLLLCPIDVPGENVHFTVVELTIIYLMSDSREL